MRVRLLVSRSGLSGAQNVGDEIDVSDADAIRMIEAGQAEPVRAVPVETMAVAPRSEKARGRRR